MADRETSKRPLLSKRGQLSEEVLQGVQAARFLRYVDNVGLNVYKHYVELYSRYMTPYICWVNLTVILVTIQAPTVVISWLGAKVVCMGS